MSIEHNLVTLNEAFCYQIPKLTSGDGYKCSDWDVESFMWSGRVRVVEKGDEGKIVLDNARTGELFAECIIEEDGSSVTRVIDSSRYFVLKISDGQGHHALIGMGFNERSHAFDFNVAVQRHITYLQRKDEEDEKEESNEEYVPKYDYSGLKKDAQKLKSGTGGSKKKKGGGFKMDFSSLDSDEKPKKSSGARRKKGSSKSSDNGNSNSTSNDDGFDFFSTSTTSNNSNNNNTNNNNNSNEDPFKDWVNFN